MRRLLCLPLLLTAAAVTATETSIPPAALETAARLRDAAMVKSEAYFIVESLTTEVGARLAGTEADARAVAWAQRTFAALGYDRVYTEPVRFPVWHRRAESARIVEPFPHTLAVTALGWSSGTGRRGIEAEVVDFADLEALRAARPEHVRGKIVFIGNRMQRARDGAGYGPAVAARVEGAQVAAALGARALLIRSIGTDRDRLPHTGTGLSYGESLKDPAALAAARRTRSGLPLFETPIPAAALSNPDADLLARVLERSRPVKLALTLDVGARGEYESYNVIGEITGSSRPEEVVLIGAHLDSWDLGTGAIDDGAGVGITMAAGHLIKRLGLRPSRTLRVVAYANEEQGIFGGKAYAEAHATSVTRHVLGAESDFGAGRVYAVRFGIGAHARGAAEAISRVLAPIGIAYEASGGGPGPDIAPMAARGMAWAQLAQDGSDYFDWHHTANDTLDKIDPKALDQNVAAYAALVWMAAEAVGDFGSAPVSPAPAPSPPSTRP